MDFSALTEEQQQQHQQQYQQHYEQQYQQEQQQAYDPAQAQAYEAYYAAYHQQQYDPSAASHHQYYYPQDYAASYQQYQDPVAAPQQDPSAPQTQSADASQAAMAHYGGEASEALAPPGVPGHEYPQEQQSSYPLPPGLNPAAAAAVAALSQLTQFAGTMDAAERAMAGMQERQWYSKNGQGMTESVMGGAQPHHYPYHYPMQHGGMRPGVGGRPAFRGGGKRGGRPFRGAGGSGSRGKFGHHQPRPDGGAPPFRGRGRGGRMGRGGGRRFHRSASETEPASFPAHVPVAEPQPAHVPVAETQPVQTQASAPAPVPPRRPPPPLAWCDICRVDCNSLEILEQHKNGKKHKKTVQRFEQIQAQQKLLAESQAQVSVQRREETQAQTKLVVGPQEKITEKPGNVEESNAVQVGKQNKASAESEVLQDVSLTDMNKMETEHQNQDVDRQSEGAKEEGTSEVLPDEGLTRPRMDGYERGRPPKRKMTRCGRGGKRLRNFEPVRSRPPERPKEPHRVCTLCNVMCESQVVFDSHLAGKKHASRIKRFEGQEAVFGPVRVYIPPNQASNYAQDLQPLFYGIQTQEMIQLVGYEHQGLAMETGGVQEAERDEQAVPEPQTKQDGVPLGFQVLGTEGQPVATVKTEGQNAASESKVEEVALTADAPKSCDKVVEAEPVTALTTTKEIIAPSQGYGDSSDIKAEEILASGDTLVKDDATITTMEDIVPTQEFGISAEHVILSGLDFKEEEVPASCDSVVEHDTAFTIFEGLVSTPELGVDSAEHCILPGLQLKVEPNADDHGEPGNQGTRLQ